MQAIMAIYCKFILNPGLASSDVLYSSKVYSADMFYTAFKTDPMSSREGRRYRHTVLERGGSQDEMKTLIEFLGREPDTNAFYRELGLV